MERLILRDDQWARIKDLMLVKSTDCGVTASNNRLFLEAVLWIARTGAPWRDLPTCFGHCIESMYAITAGHIKDIGFAFLKQSPMILILNT